jgi:hypothetical protein
VHVERQRGGRAALAQRFIGDGVVEKAASRAAPRLRNGEFEKSFRTKAIVILDRMRRLPIVAGGTGSEIRRQFQAALLQSLLIQ